MRHIINGCPIHLRGLSAQELDNLVASTQARLAQVQEELDSVVGEKIRRDPAVVPLFHLSAVPPYLMDPA